MRRVILSLLILLATGAVAQEPVVRAKLVPPSGIIVGQPVRLVVEVLVPNYFTGSPDFPEFELNNAIVVLPQETPQNSNEQIGVETYAGITETYTLYPQQPGDFSLPPAQISVPYANAPPKMTVARVLLPQLMFHAEIPAAAQDLSYFLPTTQLTMQQKWSSQLKGLRAGDTITRTVTVSAMKMQAMLIPPLPFEAPDGIRVYQEEPSVQDQKTDRGEFVQGRRIESTKYFIQKEGDYTLPAIELKWWNLSTNRLVTAVLPAVHFTAASNPNYVAELPPEPEPAPVAQPKHMSLWAKYKFWIRMIAPCCIAFLFLVWIGWHYLPRIYRRLRAWREGREQSEAAYFRNLQRACRRGRSMQAYQCLLNWTTIAHPGVSVHKFLRGVSDPRLASETENLGASLFAIGNRQQWDNKRMAQLLKRHRDTQIASLAKHRELMKLNP
ncbi:BatD family protein [Alloacidobacterium sp.]|uniref:BatD family protein n=1 Tax=Alloacidobacterium sp. TaxID=2951999 RepID=UPI002D545389|nr:BatD family protein [Alloacidobacterium sp.]HYK34429.1 BatD family protein [Alloacidobacterium sp.]